MFVIDKIHNKGNTDGFINTHSAYRINEFQTKCFYTFTKFIFTVLPAVTVNSVSAYFI